MGPNGAGKTTLSNVLTGRDGYDVTGTVTFDGIDLLGAHTRGSSRRRASSSPSSIPSRSPASATCTSCAPPSTRYAATAACRSSAPSSSSASPRSTWHELGDGPGVPRPARSTPASPAARRSATRSCRCRCSNHDLAILDETDSGLDIDALRVVAQGIERLRSPDRSMLIITHHPRLLDDVRPDRVHVLSGGRIVRSGGHELAHELEADGYGSTQITVPA
ncbi:MAG: Fe-S cluster assembly ATPase SufC [Ilumatobacteraceae bacterium]